MLRERLFYSSRGPEAASELRGFGGGLDPKSHTLDQGGASAARHCPEMEGVESEVEVGCLYAVSQRASVESSIMSHEACEALREQDLWEEDQQMEGFYTQCDVEAAYEQGL